MLCEHLENHLRGETELIEEELVRMDRLKPERLERRLREVPVLDGLRSPMNSGYGVAP